MNERGNTTIYSQYKNKSQPHGSTVDHLLKETNLYENLFKKRNNLSPFRKQLEFIVRNLSPRKSHTQIALAVNSTEYSAQSKIFLKIEGERGVIASRMITDIIALNVHIGQRWYETLIN